MSSKAELGDNEAFKNAWLNVSTQRGVKLIHYDDDCRSLVIYVWKIDEIFILLPSYWVLKSCLHYSFLTIHESLINSYFLAIRGALLLELELHVLSTLSLRSKNVSSCRTCLFGEVNTLRWWLQIFGNLRLKYWWEFYSAAFLLSYM